MDMQTVISEKTRRALWDLLAERDTVDNTLSKASEILAAAECFGIKVDSDSFRSQDEIVRIEALIKQNATSARYPAVKSLVTRLLDIELKRLSKPGPNPTGSSPTTEGNPPLVEKHLQTDDSDSDIVVGPIIHCSSRPKRNKPIVESNNEEEVSDDEDVPLMKRPRTVRSSSLGTGSGIFGWPQELCKKFAMCIEGSKWSENEPLLVKLWADGLKDGQLQEMKGSKACNNCQRTGYICAVPPGIVNVRCLHCHAGHLPRCSLISRPYRDRGGRLSVSRSASSEDHTASTSKGSTPTIKRDTTSPAPIQQTTPLIEKLKFDINQLLRDALTK